MQHPAALRVDATGLAYRPVAYRLTRTTAIRLGWPVSASGRNSPFGFKPPASLSLSRLRVCSFHYNGDNTAIGF